MSVLNFSDAKLENGGPKIMTPRILSPSNNSSIYFNSITVVSSNFVSTNSDTHATSDWKITSDSAGKNVISSNLVSTDLTTHIFKDLNLTRNTTYYIFVRYNGSTSGSSLWSNPIAFKFATIPTSSRRLYRHTSGMGSVLEFLDKGTSRKVLILDAQYRFAAATGPNYYISDEQNVLLYSAGNTVNTNGNNWLNGVGSLNVNTSGSPTMADVVIDSLWGDAYESCTSKVATDAALAVFSNTGYAWARVRNVTVNGQACDVPNFRTMLRLFFEGDRIDALDPTVNSYTRYALGKRNPCSDSSYFQFKCSVVYPRGKELEFVSVNLKDSNYICSYQYYGGSIAPIIDL